MAGVFRQVQTVFWQDNYIMDLLPKEKLFYLWLLTNPKVNQSGCYEISKHIAMLETGLKKNEIDDFLIRFEKDKKIEYCEETKEVFIINWFKHNSIKNPNIYKNAKANIENIKHSEFKKMAIQCLSKPNATALQCHSNGDAMVMQTHSQEEKEKEEEYKDEEEDNSLDSINNNTHEGEPEITGDTLIALTSACDSIQVKERKVQILFQAIQKDKKLWNALSNGGADLTTLTEVGQTLCEILTESQIRKLTADDYLQLSAKWIHAKLSKNPKIYFYKCYEDMIQKRAV